MKIEKFFYESKGSYPTLKKLLNVRNDKDFNMTEDIKQWYYAQEIISIMKKPNPKAYSVYARYTLDKPYHTIQIDLLSFLNDRKRKYVMCLVDVASRFKFAYAITNKRPETTLSKFKIFWESIGKKNQVKIQTVATDGGGEFKGVFHQFLMDNNIKHYVPAKANHLSMVEHFNLILARKLIRPLQVEAIRREKDIGIGWVKRLQLAVTEINDTENSAIKMKPNIAIKLENVKQKRNRISKDDRKLFHPLRTKCRRLLKNDEVLDLVHNKISVGKKRGTDPIWSINIFTVTKLYTITGLHYHAVNLDPSKPSDSHKDHYTYWQLQPILDEPET
jgi:hypothetical protein